MGKQLNFYRSAELLAELETDAAKLTKQTGRKHTVQDVLRIAYRSWKNLTANSAKKPGKARA